MLCLVTCFYFFRSFVKKNKLMNIAVYCSSSNLISEKYHKVAKTLGEWIVTEEHTLLFGGAMMGLMGTLAKTIEESGGKRIGIISEAIYKMEEVLPDAKGLEIVDTLEERKIKFASLADVHIVLPGGFGTLDEALAILALKQTGENHTPLIFFDVDGFYEDLKMMFDKMYKEAFAPVSFKEHYCFCKNLDEVADYIHNFNC